MITLDECIALCGLDGDEIAAICEHEHIPEVAAAALADYLLHQENGERAVATMIRDDIRTALARGDRPHAASLLVTLRHFLAQHPPRAV